MVRDLGQTRLVREVEKTFQSHKKTHHKNDFPLKPNHLRNRLDTTPAPPLFPPQTNDFQKPIKFVSTSGKVFFGKERERRLVRRNRLRSRV
jgi:hypothetical protein